MHRTYHSHVFAARLSQKYRRSTDQRGLMECRSRQIIKNKSGSHGSLRNDHPCVFSQSPPYGSNHVPLTPRQPGRWREHAQRVMQCEQPAFARTVPSWSVVCTCVHDAAPLAGPGGKTNRRTVGDTQPRTCMEWHEGAPGGQGERCSVCARNTTTSCQAVRLKKRRGTRQAHRRRTVNVHHGRLWMVPIVTCCGGVTGISKWPGMVMYTRVPRFRTYKYYC